MDELPPMGAASLLKRERVLPLRGGEVPPLHGAKGPEPKLVRSERERHERERVPSARGVDRGLVQGVSLRGCGGLRRE